MQNYKNCFQPDAAPQAGEWAAHQGQTRGNLDLAGQYNLKWQVLTLAWSSAMRSMSRG